MYCNKCGKEMPDGSAFCTNCGASFTVKTEAAPEKKTPVIPTWDFSESEDCTGFSDFQNKAIVKLLCIMSYLGLTVLIPVILFRSKPYIKHHANNGLVLLIFTAGFSLFTMIPWVGWILGTPALLYLVTLTIIGLVDAAVGTPFNMPLLGKIRILK